MTRSDESFLGILGDMLIGLLVLPIEAAIAVVHMAVARRFREPVIPCRVCGAGIVLVQLWECTCGFSWYGHYFIRCEVCSEIPAYITCTHCGASTVNPVVLASR